MDASRERTPAERDYYQEVADLLASFEIGTSAWGTGAAKTVADLAREVAQGESVLVDDEAGLVRVVSGIAMDVLAERDGVRYRLIEDRQELTNGIVKRRGLSTSLGEKIKTGESIEQVAARALSEELGIDASSVDIDITDDIAMNDRHSSSYPGLTTLTILRYVRVRIGQDQFVADGYVEIQPNKSTYFVWQPELADIS